MTPQRLPRPGQVKQLCRLCEAELEVSLDNPRRICGKCGEINLPSDHAGDGPRVLNAARPPRELKPDVVHLGLGAATPLAWALASVLGSFVGLPRGPLLPIFSLASIATAWWFHKRLGGSGLRTAGFWTLGFFGGLALAYVLVMGGTILFFKLLWR